MYVNIFVFLISSIFLNERKNFMILNQISLSFKNKNSN